MKKLTKSCFLERVLSKHIHVDSEGEFVYDYGDVVYTTNREKVSIRCKLHGVFEQSPDNHLSGYGCPTCGGSKKLSKNDFVERATHIHGDRYDYLKVYYKNIDTKVKIICKEHGLFEQTPSKHILRKYNCPKCRDNKPLTNEDFVERAKKIHRGLYDYSLVNYEKSTQKVKIICHKHGVFMQRPNAHLLGGGCNKCGRRRQGFSRNDFLNSCAINNKEGLGTIYLIRCYNKEESFYKVGITSGKISRRFVGAKMPYKYEVLKTRVGNPKDIFDLEVRVKRLVNESQYTPKNRFSGYTECFTNIELAINAFEKTPTN